MSNINVWVGTGNLTRDPNCHYNGQTCERAIFSIAVNKTWFKDDEKKEKTSYIDCKAFGSQAKFIGGYVKKGASVAIEGELDLERWETQDGQKRSKLVVKVNSIQLTDKPGDDAPGHHGHYQQPDHSQQQQQQQFVDPNDPEPF